MKNNNEISQLILNVMYDMLEEARLDLEFARDIDPEYEELQEKYRYYANALIKAEEFLGKLNGL